MIDDDQGDSGSRSQRHAGFEKLLVAVAAGQVGTVVSIEASRLARNGETGSHFSSSAASSEP